jgi:hypothetical protein
MLLLVPADPLSGGRVNELFAQQADVVDERVGDEPAALVAGWSLAGTDTVYSAC